MIHLPRTPQHDSFVNVLFVHISKKRYFEEKTYNTYITSIQQKL